MSRQLTARQNQRAQVRCVAPYYRADRIKANQYAYEILEFLRGNVDCKNTVIEAERNIENRLTEDPRSVNRRQRDLPVGHYQNNEHQYRMTAVRDVRWVEEGGEFTEVYDSDDESKVQYHMSG